MDTMKTAPDILGMLEQQVARKLVRYAASQHMFCPQCETILDMRETVLTMDTADHTLVQCATCYGRPIGNIKAGSVTVYDGRALWRPRSTKRNWAFA